MGGMRWAVLLAIAASLAVGCQHEPRVGGVSLLCKDSSTCPEGLRCYKGGCIENSPPTLAVPAVVTARVGEPFTIEAQAEDPEGDPLTFDWQQLADFGEPVSALTITGAKLTATAEVVGLHVFVVTASDGFLESQQPSARIEVHVEPTSPTTFVSQLGGTDSESCGSFSEPCATLVQGLLRHAAEGTEGILLAAATAPYHACLSLTGAEVVSGCYEPGGWAYNSDLRSQCRVECDENTGHLLDGNARVSDLTLSVGQSVAADGGVPLTTVHVKGGAPTLTDVDILTPACGESCTSVGLESKGASPIIERVEVRGDVQGFTPLSVYVGFYLDGGSPQLIGSPAVRSVDDGGRGGVLLDAPVSDRAYGIINVRSNAVIKGMSIAGGLGSNLAGIDIYGGSPTIQGALLQLTGFGTRSVSGIRAQACTNDSAPCGCSYFEQDCDSFVPTPPVVTYVPVPTVEDSEIDLSAGPTDLGLAPCLGSAISHQGATVGALVSNNRVTVGNGFTLALGITSGDVGVVGTAPNVFTANRVTVGNSEVDPVCAFLNQQENQDVDAGAVGVALFGDSSAELRGNTLDVGSSAETSAGLYLVGGDGYAVADNVFQIGDPASSVVAKQAYGAILAGSGGNPSSFERNIVLPRGGATASVGVGLVGDVTWRLANNLIHGGLAPNSIGLSLGTTTPLPDWPKIIHNTISGGGDDQSGLTSRAVLLVASNKLSNKTGVLANNLLDAGGALGRRFIFDNPTLSTLASGSGNIAQWQGSIPGPEPDLVIPSGAYTFNFGATQAEGAAWQVLMRGMGEVVTINAVPGALWEGASVATGGRPTASWSDGVMGQAAVAVVVPGGVGLARMVEDSMSDFTFYPTLSYTGGVATSRHPAAVAVGEWQGGFPPDLLFIERKDGATPGSLWVMQGSVGSGFAPPVDAKVTLDDPTLVAVRMDAARAGDRNDVVIVDGSNLVVMPYNLVLDATGLGAISSVKFFHLNEETLATTGRSMDLAVLAATGIHVFVNPDFAGSNGTSLPAEATFATPPCDASTVETFSFAQVKALSASKELALACGDGTLELYEYGAGTFTQLKKTSSASPIPVPATMSLIPLSSQKALALTIVAGANTAQLFYIDASVVNPSVTGPFNLDFTADIAMRSNSGLQTTFSGMPSGSITVPVTPCALMAQNGGNPQDLHLAPTDTTCANNGDQQVVEPDDVDGLGTRTDGFPDVGADELP